MEHASTAAVAFTGSHHAGRALFDAANAASGGTMLTAGIRDAFEKHRDTLLAIDGVTPLTRASAAGAGATASRPVVAMADAKRFLASAALATEAFGPFTLVILTEDIEEMCACARALPGQLTATLHGTDADLAIAGPLIALAERFAGRLIVNGSPTGVEVSPAMHHGGPYPATTDVRFTSVGTAAILRFARPVCYQGFAEAWLPVELRNANPTGILRTVNGELTRDAI